MVIVGEHLECQVPPTLFAEILYVSVNFFHEYSSHLWNSFHSTDSFYYTSVFSTLKIIKDYVTMQMKKLKRSAASPGLIVFVLFIYMICFVFFSGFNKLRFVVVWRRAENS